MEQIIFKNRASQYGFTLIEMALVIMISGFMMMAGAQVVKLYAVNLKYEKTLNTLSITQDALFEFFGREGRYPCPADPTLQPNDINYGLERCRPALDLANNPDDCTGTPTNIFCPDPASIFSRDGDQNGQPDIIMIGIIPFRTLTDTVSSVPYVENYRLDGYSTYLSYAVTEHMTNNTLSPLNPANPNTGAIRVIDENDISVTTPDDSAHYVVYSHGENRRGGFTPTGVMIDDCLVSLVQGDPPSIPAPGPSVGGIDAEIENCDNNDAIFRKGIRSLADNGDYNDDILFFKATGFNSLWVGSLASPNSIYNTNIGNVGVGTNTPEEKLHIAGDLSVQSHTVSNSYCHGAGNDCLLPSAIAGSGSAIAANGTQLTQCPPNEAAYAIHENSIVCRSVNWTMPAQNCPSGEYLVGFSNIGNIECALPPP